MDNIKVGTDINKVKSTQPDFITIDWNNPEVFETTVRFSIKKIRGNNDALNMSHYLVFENNKYLRRESRK
jgi:hypothetical protein